MEEQGNGYNPERTSQIVGRIEERHAMIESIMGKAKQECKGVHEDIADLYTEAKDAWGIPKRALKQVVKTRALERKLEDIRENLEPDDQESYDQIRHALGDLADLPLGQAPLDAALLGELKAASEGRPRPGRPRKVKPEANGEAAGDEEDPRPRHLKQNEADRDSEAAALDAAVADNGAERLHGLSPVVN